MYICYIHFFIYKHNVIEIGIRPLKEFYCDLLKSIFVVSENALNIVLIFISLALKVQINQNLLTQSWKG